MDTDHHRRSIAALALIGEAGELCRRGRPDTIDRTDRLALEGQLGSAVGHVLSALEAGDRWNALDARRKEWAIGSYGARYLKRMPEPDCLPCLVVAAESLLMHLLDQGAPGADEISGAVAHLQCAIHLLNPAELPDRIAHSDPQRRVALGERMREIEKDVGATRDRVRTGG